MRVSRTAILAAAGVVLLMTLPAEACQELIGAPPPPKILWATPPTTVEPDEVVLEVEFSRYAAKLDLGSEKDVIVVDCGPFPHVFRVTRVLAGDAPPNNEVVSWGWFSPDPKGIIVGRLRSSFPGPEVGFRLADENASLPTIQPRLPPG